MPFDDGDSEPAVKRRKSTEADEHMELEGSTLQNDVASSMRSLSGRISPMDADDQAECGGSSHSAASDATGKF